MPLDKTGMEACAGVHVCDCVCVTVCVCVWLCVCVAVCVWLCGCVAVCVTVRCSGPKTSRFRQDLA